MADAATSDIASKLPTWSWQLLRLSAFACPVWCRPSARQAFGASGSDLTRDFLRPVASHVVAEGPDGKRFSTSVLPLLKIRHSGRPLRQSLLHPCVLLAPSAQATVEVAFKVVEKVLTDPFFLAGVHWQWWEVNFDDSYHIFVENFTDGIRALLSFAQCKALHTDVFLLWGALWVEVQDKKIIALKDAQSQGEEKTAAAKEAPRTGGASKVWLHCMVVPTSKCDATGQRGHLGSGDRVPPQGDWLACFDRDADASMSATGSCVRAARVASRTARKAVTIP